MTFVLGLRLCFGYFLASNRSQFSADNIGGKAGAQEAAVHRSDFVFGDFTAEGAEFALETLADYGGFVGFFGGFFKAASMWRSGTPRARKSRAMRNLPWRRISVRCGRIVCANRSSSIILARLRRSSRFQQVIVFGSPAKHSASFRTPNRRGASRRARRLRRVPFRFQLGAAFRTWRKHSGKVVDSRQLKVEREKRSDEAKATLRDRGKHTSPAKQRRANEKQDWRQTKDQIFDEEIGIHRGPRSGDVQHADVMRVGRTLVLKSIFPTRDKPNDAHDCGDHEQYISSFGYRAAASKEPWIPSGEENRRYHWGCVFQMHARRRKTRRRSV